MVTESLPCTVQIIPGKLGQVIAAEALVPGIRQAIKNYDINSIVQDCSNSIANALELLQSCTKPLSPCLVNTSQQPVMFESLKLLWKQINGHVQLEQLECLHSEIPSKWIQLEL